MVKDEPAAVQHAIRDEIARGRARAIITTGGTGIAKRDSTYEAVTDLFEKRLDGFGELFRMLSYQEIGSAAMLSRATAGVAYGCIIFMLPGFGSGGAARHDPPDPSRTRPHRQGAHEITMRPITETMLYDDAIAVVMDAAVPIAIKDRVALLEADGRVLSAMSWRRWTCRRSIAPRWTATRSSPRTRLAPARTRRRR